MLLVIDLGNTNVALGIYKNDELIHFWRLSTEHIRMPDEYGLQILNLLTNADIPIESIDGICVSSVVPPLTNRILEACEKYLNIKPLLVSADLKLNIQIKYENPYAVGTDRIADAVAVQKTFGGPACIIDFGTATTFNALTADGSYLGGSILPGVRVSADALVSRTSKLPSVSLETPPSVIGRNTIQAIQAGLVFGYVSLVEGMIERYRKELGKDMKVIATGGFVHLISQHTNVIKIVDQELTMNGIYYIWEMNK